MNFNKNQHVNEKFFSEYSWHFSRMYFYMTYIVVKFQTPGYNAFRNMNFFLVNFKGN